MNRGLITAIVIVALACGVVLLGMNSAPRGVPPGAQEKSSTEGAGPSRVLAPVKRVIECEEYATIEDKAPNGRTFMLVREETHGQALKYLEMPDDELRLCRLDKEEKVGGKFPGLASYIFDVPRDDTYYLFLRAQWFDDCGNSVFVKFDDGEWLMLEDKLGMKSKTNYMWVWHPLSIKDGAVHGIPLSKGRHTLWLNTREDGPKLDQWLVSTDANPPPNDKPLKDQP